MVGEKAVLKDKSEIVVLKMEIMNGDQKMNLKEKRKKNIYYSKSPPSFTLDNYKEVLFEAGLVKHF